MPKKYWTPPAPQGNGEQTTPDNKDALKGFIIIGVIIAIVWAACSGGDEQPTSTQAPADAPTAAMEATEDSTAAGTEAAAAADVCDKPNRDTVASVKSGVNGRRFGDATVVTVPEDEQVDRPFGAEATFPAKIVAARIREGVATFGLSKDGGFILALNDAARRGSFWGEAANPGSPAADMRDAAAALPHAEIAAQCVDPAYSASNEPEAEVAPEVDASAQLACGHWRNVFNDISSGILTTEEIREKVQEVYDDASVSERLGIRDQATALLRAATQDDGEAFIDAAVKFNRACERSGAFD